MGAIKLLCAKLNIRIIRGRPYHPQSQGSIEVANRIFKKRLRAAQLGYGHKDWVSLLPEIAFVINTTTSRALPRGKTPFDIWFGRPRRWLHQMSLQGGEEEEEEEEEDEEDIDSAIEDNDPVLTAIEEQVARNNVKVREQMRKKGGKTPKVFEDNEVATLAIPRKMRLNTESSRLAVRVLNQTSSGYKLLTQHGLLKGRHQGGELNKIDSSTSQILGIQIPLTAPMENGKVITKSLPEVVQLENQRVSISELQKKGRGKGKAKGKANVKGRGKKDSSGSKGDIEGGEEVVVISDDDDNEWDEFDNFGSSSQEYYSLPEEGNDIENCSYHSQDRSLLEDDENEDRDSETPIMSTPIRQSSRIPSKRVHFALSPPILSQKTSSKSKASPKAKASPKSKVPKSRVLPQQTAPQRASRIAAKRAAAAISEMASIPPLPKRRRRI